MEASGEHFPNEESILWPETLTRVSSIAAAGIRLQDVAYDAEDVLDEFAYKILRKEQKKGKVRECFSLHNPFAFRLNMGQKVKKINEVPDKIQENAAVLGLGSTSLCNMRIELKKL
uniref:Disease resistance N-terminal domain-containing protein n=1 Tax=Salix viminalis TaxID=40686 RepID=A0A6N2MWX8_SALVM